ncbi:MAG: rfaE bifunctional protein [Planctomycetota bacterium]|nr:rfaE bifunctional protein [Planctomycetota bacterium]
MSHANERDLSALIGEIRPSRVAVIGDVMLDRYVRGQAGRLSPEAPIQVLEVGGEDTMLGGAANVAHKAVGLGGRVTLVGLVGEDADAEEFRDLVAASGSISPALVADPSRCTTVKTRFIAQNQQLLRVDREVRGVPSPRALKNLAEAAFEAAREADAVILEDYGKGVLSAAVIRAALDGARSRNVPVVVDPNGRDYRRYAGATVLTPNVKEAEVAAERPIMDEETLVEAAGLLVEQTEGAAIAITRDSRGISLFRREGDSGLRHDHVPTIPVQVYDVTGAGDAVAATLALALASNVDLEDACALANLAGRAIVRQFGVGTISLGHLRDEVSAANGRPNKVVGVDRAIERVREVRRGGGKVSFTNGCFDILHYGHAFLLQYARSEADFLVLGLNTDASVRRFKGTDRPYVSEAERSYMLSLYPFVDLIVLFDDDTPMDLISALRPDVLVKGGDYTPDTVVGRDFVESYGGRVAICPRLEGLSTTNIVKKILQRGAA